MRSRIRAVAIGLALLVGVSAAAEAQAGPMTFGPRVMYHFDGSDFGIGAEFTKPLTDAIRIAPSFGYWFVGEGVTSWEINADLHYKMPAESLSWLYLGAGLNYSKISVDGCDAIDDILPGFSDLCSSSDVGLNLIGGFEPSSSSRIKPFAEARLYVGSGSGISVAGGIRIPLGN